MQQRGCDLNLAAPQHCTEAVMSPLNPADTDAIERATLAAVAPETWEEIDGWLVPLDSGTIGRAQSAVPLWAGKPSLTTLTRIEDCYRAAGLPPKFRLSDHPHFGSITQTLQTRGYRATKPTLVQVASTRSMLQAHGNRVEVEDQADEAWSNLFLGPGFDPMDGANRVRSLSRSSTNVYASLRENGQTVAGGVGSFSYGWASVHGMRTDAAHRGTGLAAQVLAALASAAIDRGFDRCFLQVEAHNLSALSLYRRAGFQTVWSYAYWARP